MVSDFEGSVTSSIRGVDNYVLGKNDIPQNNYFSYMTLDMC